MALVACLPAGERARARLQLELARMRARARRVGWSHILLAAGLAIAVRLAAPQPLFWVQPPATCSGSSPCMSITAPGASAGPTSCSCRARRRGVARCLLPVLA